MLYTRIKDNHDSDCIHANKTYQEFEDTITVYYNHIAYYIKHRTIEYFISNWEEDTQEIFISKNIWDEVNWDCWEDIYHYKCHNRSIDWIELVTNAIQDDYHQPEEDDWWVF